MTRKEGWPAARARRPSLSRMASDRSASNDYVPCATLNGRGTHAATAEVIAIIYNFLPSLPLALPSAATRRNHKAVYDHSCSQSVGPPARGTGVCVSACADRNREAASSAAAVPILPTARRRDEEGRRRRRCDIALWRKRTKREIRFMRSYS